MGGREKPEEGKGREGKPGEEESRGQQRKGRKENKGKA